MDRPTELPVPRFVRRAEDFIRAHVGDEITLRDVAKAAGVSGLSLHRGFRNFRDTTPVSHLKSMRLAAARQALLGRRPRP